MNSQRLFDDKGTPIFLSKEIGKGGEGAVYTFQNNSSLVAKIYFSTPNTEKHHKISEMIRMGNERLLKLAAWPINTIHTSDKKLIGFTMPMLVDHKPIFELYSPKIRLREFPKADWRFLIHAATNTAKAFSVIHDSGHVIGDVNHGNLFVASDATVQFIDTDSFQIHSDNKYWFCEVGVSTHQPPEMQLTSYKGIVRTPNHDNFGLAIIIFQLLCLARHPFSGKYSGSGDMPIEKAIIEHRYAYSSNQTLTRMSPPPASLSMNALTPTIRNYFEKAFSKEGEKFGARPTSKDWIFALTELSSKLKNCPTNQSHYYFTELKKCPWCEIETQCNMPFFAVIGPKSKVEINISTLWQQFLGIKNPGGSFNFPDTSNSQTTPSNEAKQIRKKLNQYQMRFILGMLIATPLFAWLTITTFPLLIIFPIVTVLFYSYYKTKKKSLAKKVISEYKLLKQRSDEIHTRREALLNNYTFEQLNKQIIELKQKHDALKSEREAGYKNLLQNRFNQQLKRYLDTIQISAASIEGIGQGRIATLQSYLIETAGDIDYIRLMSISGFGRVLVSRLLDWRKACEAKFVFNSNKGIDPALIATLDCDINSKRQKLESDLSGKISQLALLSKQITTAKQSLKNQMYEIFPKYTQALADAKEIKLKI